MLLIPCSIRDRKYLTEGECIRFYSNAKNKNKNKQLDLYINDNLKTFVDSLLKTSNRK
jgi:hypothetical protein